jgi:lysophospholipase
MVQQLFHRPGNPAPDNAISHSVFTDDGLELRAMTGLLPEARGTVVVLNGRADFLERYFETMCDAQARGYSVASFDWRGQGGSQRQLSDRKRGYVRSFSDYDDDLRSFTTQILLKHCPKPYYVIAHSTGGNVLLRSLMHRTVFKKAVLVAPLLELRYGLWPILIIRILNTLAWVSQLSWMYLPGRKKPPLLRRDFLRNPLTSDESRWARDVGTLEEHPELATHGPTFAWLRACMASIGELKNWPKNQPVSCPTLMVTAGNETVVDARAGRFFTQHVRGISFMQIAGAKHEILIEAEPYRQAFWGAFDAFIGS